MQMYLKPPTDVVCPQFQKPMAECCPTCVKWVTIRGACPNTGKDIDGHHCSDVAVLLAVMELSKLVNEAGAATESMRNEVVKRLNIGLAGMAEQSKPRLSLFARKS